MANPDPPGRSVSNAWDDFFEQYDVAVIGTVTEIRTIEAAGPDHGATTVSVNVAAVLGDDAAPPRLELSSPDPG